MDNIKLDVATFEASISHTRNGYGFGHDWSLNVRQGDKRNWLFLGQDAKVVRRMMGMSDSDLRLMVNERLGLDPATLMDMDDEPTNQAITRILFECVADQNEVSVEDIQLATLTMQPWEFSAE